MERNSREYLLMSTHNFTLMHKIDHECLKLPLCKQYHRDNIWFRGVRYLEYNIYK